MENHIEYFGWPLAFVVFTINLTPVVELRIVVRANSCSAMTFAWNSASQYIQAWTPNNVKYSMKPRKEDFIYLSPVGNVQGSSW